MSVNKAILVGNVGADPEVKYFENGDCVAHFSLATTERGYIARNGQQIADRTEWHTIITRGPLAKFAEAHIRKGAQLYVEGKIRNTNYEDRAGNTQYRVEIAAETVQFIGRPPQ